MSPLLISLFVFVIAASFTPGPNNIMLTASGVNFGFKRTIPHMLGIIVGFPVMLLLVGVGLGQIFILYPQLHDVLKWLGSAYLLFLAWKIATAAQPKQGKKEAKPFSFLQAALFQWVNPKGWIMSVAALANYTSVDGNYLIQTLLVACVFFLISLGATSAWTFFGALVGRLLQSELALKIFNAAMAALIVASIALLYL